MTGAIIPSIKGCLTMQRNANMLKILKKCVFADFIGFFVKMQSPDCPPNRLFSFGTILVKHHVSMDYKAQSRH
jgi:hypothetical protein